VVAGLAVDVDLFWIQVLGGVGEDWEPTVHIVTDRVHPVESLYPSYSPLQFTSFYVSFLLARLSNA
jgi:hypothetical protein